MPDEEAIDLLRCDAQFGATFGMTVEDMALEGARLEFFLRQYLYENFAHTSRAGLMLTAMILEKMCREQANPGCEEDAFKHLLHALDTMRGIKPDGTED